MIATIIICITIVILAIIGAGCYYIHLKDLENRRLEDMPEPKDDKIYLDRLKLLKRRYDLIMSEFNMNDDALTDEHVFEDIKCLISFIGTITDRLY